MPSIHVIIVNFNAGDWLAKSVRSVLAQTYPNFRCTIVDNGSTDSSVASLPPLDDRFEIVEAGENLGFAAGCNLAALTSEADWIAMLNPDAFARAGWLEALIATTEQAENVTMVGSTQYMALEDGVLDGAGDFYHASGLAWRGGFGHPASTAPKHIIEAFGPCGAGALYHGETFRKLGGYDARFFCYHEDVDLAYRMRLAGGICLQSPNAIIDHVSSAISGRASAFAVYHGTRNRIWTFAKNTPLSVIPLLLPLHVALNLFMLFWAGLRSGRFRPTFHGIKDGIGGLSDIIASRKAVKAHRTLSLSDVLRQYSWTVGPVRKRTVPDYCSTSPKE